MKKMIFSCFIALAAIGGARAQSLIFEDLYVSGIEPNRFLDLEVVTHVLNNTAGPLTLRWHRTQNIPANWQTAICDFQCYDPAVSTMDITVASGSNQALKANFYAMGSPDSGDVYLDVFVVGDSAATVQRIQFHGVIGYSTSSVGTVPTSNDMSWSNPIGNSLEIARIPAGIDANLEVYGLDGRLWAKKAIIGTTASIDAASFPRGMYIGFIRDVNGNVIAQEKLVKE